MNKYMEIFPTELIFVCAYVVSRITTLHLQLIKGLIPGKSLTLLFPKVNRCSQVLVYQWDSRAFSSFSINSSIDTVI